MDSQFSGTLTVLLFNVSLPVEFLRVCINFGRNLHLG